MNQKYDFNCLMLYYNIPNWNEIVNSIVDIEDVYTINDEFGIEYDPHITVLYGLDKDVSLEDVKSLCKPLQEYETIIDSLGVFECEGYDVLKFNVNCPNVKETNSELTDTFDYTSDFDTYIPHMTIAYLKVGAGKNYCKKLTKELKLYPSHFVYSTVDGEKEEFVL